MFGGETPLCHSPGLDSFELATGARRRIPQYRCLVRPLPRSHHSMCVFGRQLVVVGGLTCRGPKSDVWAFDLDICNWEEVLCIDSPVSGVFYHETHIVGSEIWIVVPRLLSVEVYLLDLNHSVWSLRSVFPTEASTFTSCVWRGHVFVLLASGLVFQLEDSKWMLVSKAPCFDVKPRGVRIDDWWLVLPFHIFDFPTFQWIRACRCSAASSCICNMPCLRRPEAQLIPFNDRVLVFNLKQGDRMPIVEVRLCKYWLKSGRLLKLSLLYLTGRASTDDPLFLQLLGNNQASQSLTLASLIVRILSYV